MAILVGKINGVSVYSDKEVDSIDNTRINFTDGSWCDTATGENFNNGPGYISLGAEPKSARQAVVTRRQDFPSAKSLEIANTFADITVDVHSEDGIEVVLTGPGDELQKISVKQKNDAVLIKGSGHSSHINIQSSVISMARGVIQMSSARAARQSRIQINLKVPRGVALNLSNLGGQTVVGDTHGPLMLNLTSDSKVRIGRVTDAFLRLIGNGDIDISEVNGSLSIDLVGNGDIKVAGGEVSSLTVKLMGNGDINFRGRAKTGSLTLMGNGDIKVNEITSRPLTNRVGGGDIHVGNWGNL